MCFKTSTYQVGDSGDSSKELYPFEFEGVTCGAQELINGMGVPAQLTEVTHSEISEDSTGYTISTMISTTIKTAFVEGKEGGIVSSRLIEATNRMVSLCV